MLKLGHALLFITTLLFVLLLNSACKKKPSAGLGGQATLKVRTVHHGSTIDSATVYIKFNSQEPAAMGSYDLSAKSASDGNGGFITTFSGLKAGDYYLYGEGWDPSILNNVKGGIPYTIEEETVQEVILPVTEVH